MRRIIRSLSTPTAKASAVYYFGNFGLSVGRYLFHLMLLRLLIPSEYGEFVSYLAFLYLLGIPNGAISSIVVKHVAQHLGKGDTAGANRFFYYILKKMLPITLIVGALVMLLSGQLAQLLKASSAAFIVLGISVLMSPLTVLTGSFVVALQRYRLQIISGVIQLVLMTIIAYIMIVNDFSATGVITSQIVSGIISTAVILYVVRNLIFPPKKQVNRPQSLLAYSVFSLIFSVGSLSLISLDILLVRYLFSEHISGIYSALSTLGRMVCFGLGPLNTLVLSVAAHRHAATRSSRNVFFKLGLVTVILGSVATLIFALFPSEIVSILSGNRYIEVANYLPLFTVNMFLFSLNLFVISYFMAIGKAEVNIYLMLTTLAQPILIILFHENLFQVIKIGFVLEVLLFVLLARMIYHLENETKYRAD